jgi:hypothetical protein
MKVEMFLEQDLRQHRTRIGAGPVASCGGADISPSLIRERASHETTQPRKATTREAAPALAVGLGGVVSSSAPRTSSS